MTRHDPDRDAAILTFIESFTGEAGYPPSVREIAQAVGLASTSAVQHHLDRLERGGRIARDYATARSLRVVRGGPDGGACHRPGCGRQLTGRRTRWCSATCSVRAAQMRAWLAAAGKQSVIRELGL